MNIHTEYQNKIVNQNRKNGNLAREMAQHLKNNPTRQELIDVIDIGLTAKQKNVKHLILKTTSNTDLIGLESKSNSTKQYRNFYHSAIDYILTDFEQGRYGADFTTFQKLNRGRYHLDLTDDEIENGIKYYNKGLILNPDACKEFISLDEPVIPFLSSLIPTLKKSVRNNPTTSTTGYKTDNKITNIVLERSNGHCECCNQIVPLTAKNKPVLQVHHIIEDVRFDDEGHAAGLCASCHDYIHRAIFGDELNKKLFEKINNKDNTNLLNLFHDN